MKTKVAIVLSTLIFAIVGGCAAPDVTEKSYDDAMKERGEKAAKLAEKEGNKPAENNGSNNSAAVSQDPQLSGGTTPSAPATNPTKSDTD